MTNVSMAEWSQRFKANSQITLNIAAKIINSTVDQLYTNIKERTPVGNPALWNPPYWPPGYVPGTLQKSWQISTNKNTRLSSGQFSNAGQLLQNNGVVFSVNDLRGGNTITIYNTQPYAQRVEEGWSGQAPAGMLRISLLEYSNMLDQNATKYRIK